MRNVSIIGLDDQSKKQVIRFLVAAAGVLPPLDQIQGRGESILCSIHPMHHTLAHPEDIVAMEKEGSHGNTFLINVMDTPSNMDRIAHIQGALRITDGVLVIVNCTEPVSEHLGHLLQQAKREHHQAVLMIDGLFEAMQAGKTLEQVYQLLVGTMDQVNNSLSMASLGSSEDAKPHPRSGNVVFGSTRHGWAFTLHQFARIYSARMGVPETKLLKCMWGDRFYCADTRRWQKRSSDTENCSFSRGFCKLVLHSIYKISDLILNGSKNNFFAETMPKLEITLSDEERALDGHELLHTVLRAFMPGANALLGAACLHLPSPVKSQMARMPMMHPLVAATNARRKANTASATDDECSDALLQCDPQGPLMIHIVRLVSSAKDDPLFALARVFSGTVRVGDKLYVTAANAHVYGRRGSYNSAKKQVTKIFQIINSGVREIDSCPAGNIIGLVGIESTFVCTTTITASGFKNTQAFKDIIPSVRPTMQFYTDLSQIDPDVQADERDVPSGMHSVAGATTESLDRCFKILKTRVPALTRTATSAIYRETIAEKSSKTALARSPNRRMRLFMCAEPLDKDLLTIMERGDLDPYVNWKENTKLMTDTCGWDAKEARRIWCFGPRSEEISNMMTDNTTQVQYMNEIKDACQSAFVWGTMEGPLTEEQVRGCRFKIMDMTMNADAIHRGSGQVIPACRRAMFASMLLAKPAIQESVLLVEVTCHNDVVACVLHALSCHRARLSSTRSFENQSEKSLVTAYVLSSSFYSLVRALKDETKGHYAIQSAFDHWIDVDGDPMTAGTTAKNIIYEIRRDKGLSLDIPPLNTLMDA
ncbi:hypothetical protein BC940DRAFT_354427 [Gongronella butleri]|nr:hypothetical protein BC940DRAFT_354427 [Gongronella butleri]